MAHAVDDLVLTDPGAALRRAASRGGTVAQDAEQILAAWARGLTVEAEGGWRHIGNPNDPALAATMRRLQAAIDAYHAHPGTDATSAIAAADRLSRMTNQAGEELRAAASDFSATRSGEILVPSRAPEPGRVLGPELQRGWDAAVAARERVRARPDLATTAPAAVVFTALEVATPGYRAEGTTRQPLGRTTRGVGLERAFLRPAEIGALRSETPGLAARLALLMHEWERAHMVGPGFGSELFEGLALAPWGVNHLAQNDGIEAVIRALHESGADPHAVVQANTRTLVVPLVGGGFQEFDVLGSIRYDVTTPGHGTFFFDVQVRPDGSWNVTHNVAAGSHPAWRLHPGGHPMSERSYLDEFQRLPSAIIVDLPLAIPLFAVSRMIGERVVPAAARRRIRLPHRSLPRRRGRLADGAAGGSAAAALEEGPRAHRRLEPFGRLARSHGRGERSAGSPS